MEKIFVDTDIILDLLSKREPFYIHSAKLFSAADRNEIQVCVSSLAFANINYIYLNSFPITRQEQNLSSLKRW